MRIARIEANGTQGYAVAGRGDDWLPLSSLGVDEIHNSRSLTSSIPAIRKAWEAYGGNGQVTPDRFLAPIVAPTHSLAIGRNYRLHAEETGSNVPDQPIIFTKLVGSYTGHDSEVMVKSNLTSKLDYEVELVVLIGEEASGVGRQDALSVVAGYLVGNDLSARDCQRRDGQFDYAKGMQSFGPLGPWITTADEVPDPQNLDLKTVVDGEVRQDSNTEQMIFTVEFLIEYISNAVTLQPGDVIWTGTPHGVALGMEDTPFLQDGQQVDCEIQSLGKVSNTIRFN